MEATNSLKTLQRESLEDIIARVVSLVPSVRYHPCPRVRMVPLGTMSRLVEAGPRRCGGLWSDALWVIPALHSGKTTPP